MNVNQRSKQLEGLPFVGTRLSYDTDNIVLSADWDGNWDARQPASSGQSAFDDIFARSLYLPSATPQRPSVFKTAVFQGFFEDRAAARREDPHYANIERQVAELREDAAQESEEFSQVSADYLLDYCHRLAADQKPAIFRLHNGNLRAIWQNEVKDQIGIQFLQSGELQYVILRDRGERTRKTLGTEDAETIEQIVILLGLRRLWFVG